jgi:hypothetical protein
MKYSLARASQYIGKRVIVSLRHAHPDGSETYTGLWGVVESVHEDGLRLKVEGGTDESHWAIPPDLDAFQPAQHTEYQLGDTGQVVTGVDYEMYWSIAADPAHLK